MTRPQSTFLLVYLALLCLLGLTIGAAHLQLGAFKPTVNLGIAAIKAAQVAGCSVAHWRAMSWPAGPRHSKKVGGWPVP